MLIMMDQLYLRDMQELTLSSLRKLSLEEDGAKD